MEVLLSGIGLMIKNKKMKSILFIFSFVLYNINVFSQENKINYEKFENTVYSFQLPKNIWYSPNLDLINEYRKNEINIAKSNDFKFIDFDFLLSYKTEDQTLIFTPLIKVTKSKTNENLFNKMKMSFGKNYIEKSLKYNGEDLKFSFKPLVDTNNKTITIFTKTDEITGLSKLFFSNNYLIQFTYTDKIENQCIECLIIFMDSIDKTFVFK